MNNITINADDFGASPSINQAIIELFEKGVINSTSIMSNMIGFSEAITLAHQYRIQNKIGVHLVLTEGLPLTEEIKSVKFLFQGKKPFKKPLKHSLFFLHKDIKDLIYKEFDSQIKRVKDNGIKITHLDTHHHIHEYYGITRILLDLTDKHQIPAIRILNNLNVSTIFYKRIYRNLINYYIVRNNLNFSDYFGDQVDFLKKHKNAPKFCSEKNIEIMVHPDFDSEGRLIDKCGENNYNFDFVNLLK